MQYFLFHFENKKHLSNITVYDDKHEMYYASKI